MKSIVFIHGINNQDNTPAWIEETWWSAIQQGWKAAGLESRPKPEIRSAYYADILAGESSSPQAEAMGDGAEPFSGLAMEFLKTYQVQAGIDDEEINRILNKELNEPSIEEMGEGRGVIVRIARAIASALPGNGKYLARLFLKQAAVYIDREGLRAQIHHTVSEQVFAKRPAPTVVIGHSLGTVVGFNVLCGQDFGNQNLRVPLFITLGSPLGIDMMDKVVPPFGTFPTPPIEAWFNGFRKDDFVPLDTSLKKQTIGFDGIENHRTKMIDGVDPHSIEGYLRDKAVATKLHDFL